MKFAYADPPYPGQARKHYGSHPDFGGEVDHSDLIAQLERDYDVPRNARRHRDATHEELPL